MRKIDRINNIKKVNLLAEQRYIENKLGKINEGLGGDDSLKTSIRDFKRINGIQDDREAISKYIDYAENQYYKDTEDPRNNYWYINSIKAKDLLDNHFGGSEEGLNEYSDNEGNKEQSVPDFEVGDIVRSTQYENHNYDYGERYLLVKHPNGRVYGVNCDYGTDSNSFIEPTRKFYQTIFRTPYKYTVDNLKDLIADNKDKEGFLCDLLYSKDLLMYGV